MENASEKLNLVIDYIENHLTGEIDRGEIARIACCSYYDAGRMFSLVADITISDYIRKRRLTLAGAELKRDCAKVMDVALKYGYDSPVSFARAFHAFHGFAPGDSSKDDSVPNTFPRLAYQIRASVVIDAIRKESITVNGKSYEASYFGEQDMSAWSEYAVKREFWRLENTGSDFADCEKLGEVLPYNNYPPISIEPGQVFVIDYHTKNGEIDRRYYIADGTVWHDMQSTRRIVVGVYE